MAARKKPKTSSQKGDRSEPLRAGILSEAFFADTEELEALGVQKDPKKPSSVVVELNLFHKEGLTGADIRFLDIYKQLWRDLKAAPPAAAPLRIADTYYRCRLSVIQAQKLVEADLRQTKNSSERAIYRIWPDFKMKLLMDKSVSTIKADAARRSYDASGSGIVWAVIDSGIDSRHPHFQTYGTLGGPVAQLHRDLTTDGETPGDALIDGYGHGTHVAGIIAGALVRWDSPRTSVVPFAAQRKMGAANSEIDTIEPYTDVTADRLSGVAPLCKLISLKVLDNEGTIDSTNVLRALEYVRVRLNGHGKPPLRVHGVNISLGYDFNARWFACGQSPVCIEVDRLVRSGVVVVVSAGNTGYGQLRSKEGLTSTGMSLTINDPGNSALAITVGATHKDSPHTYGVSYFSSKGPTGDGRAKPDLVAPGERILSCAAGQQLEQMRHLLANDGSQHPASYIDMSGTSMAAPHVSGAIAAFLSIRREFIGRPEDVKRIFLQSATSLGRERYFEGHGLVDLMRAIQSI
jgi:subtilisin family serine protease